MKAIQIGFWAYYKDEVTPKLPWPQEDRLSTKERRKVGRVLRQLESSITSGHRARGFIDGPFKGFSRCRLCGRRNGSCEYTLKSHNVMFTWPDGFLHYIEQHGVKPPKRFIKMLIDEVTGWSES